MLEYDMEEFLRSATQLYRVLFPTAPDLEIAGHRRVSTPCLPESHNDAEAASVRQAASGGNAAGADYDGVWGLQRR